MSPLSASALAAAFASKNAEKRSYPNNPIPSNLGPKFVPPSNPHVTVTPENSPTPSIPSIDSPPTPKSSATTTATSSPVQSATPTTPSTHNPFSLAHLLPSKTSTPMRRKPNFAFLPLLDTPPNSGDNTPTPTICTPTAMIPKLDLEPEEANKSLASPIIHNENSSCDDEQPLAGAYSSSSSSYTSDSERLFIPSLKRTQLPKHAGYFGNDVPFVLKDPRLQAVSSPVLAPPSPLSLDGEVPSGTRSLDADLATIMQARLELVEREQSTTRDVLEYTEPITRTPSSSRPYTNPQIDGAPASPESSQENTEKTTDWEEVERFRRRRLGNKWTPPSSQGPSRTSSRAPSRERNVVEINGVEIELDGDN
ncbi:hypothetical protein F5890DRAFT_1474248 [Lentinula detonsa]|uniref:Uncharacterized protein n=1 Tax=Lentinula detonsa TaxID=2804962 RepID=A0AA38PZV6_9AGAR|nr:hypothetical protein F5890DRAFT_1474248 [Lentinula detonsa]